MEKNKKIAELEALLFQSGEPVDLKKISEVLELDEGETKDVVKAYDDSLSADEKRGLSLVKKEESVQLVTSPSLDFLTEKLVKSDLKEDLTPAILEVLTIVAYLGPISRPDIDFIRGVNSSYSLRNLSLRGLVEREKKGNTYEYSVSFDLLKHFGISGVEDLPDYDKYKNLLEEYEVDR